MGVLIGMTGCANTSQMPPLRLAEGCTWDQGGIIRGPRDRRRLALVFTGGQFGEGGDAILDALTEHGVKASFFLTGDFLRVPEHDPLIRRMVADGHYVGPHSDAHLLYCDWEDRSRTLVSREQFRGDLDANLAGLSRWGLRREQMRFFIPPYEWYNRQITDWAAEADMVLVNFTSGTRSHTDWAPEGHRAFVPSQEVIEGILHFEASHSDGLNGFLLLMHLGSGPQRSDKLHPHFAPLIAELCRRGYDLVRVDTLLLLP